MLILAYLIVNYLEFLWRKQRWYESGDRKVKCRISEKAKFAGDISFNFDVLNYMLHLHDSLYHRTRRTKIILFFSKISFLSQNIPSRAKLFFIEKETVREAVDRTVIILSEQFLGSVSPFDCNSNLAGRFGFFVIRSLRLLQLIPNGRPLVNLFFFSRMLPLSLRAPTTRTREEKKGRGREITC